MTLAVYDNPNHPHYGPVRRLWVVLNTLCDMDKLAKLFPQEWAYAWDEYAVYLLEKGVLEQVVSRMVVWRAISAYEE